MGTKKKLSAPVRSMTGFGRATAGNARCSLAVEVRALNGRTLDLVLRMPREYSMYESEVRELAASMLQRGRVEISVSRQPVGEAPLSLRFNRELFDSYLDISRKVLAEFGAKDEQGAVVRDVLLRREVVEIVEQPLKTEEERDILIGSVREALSAVTAMREVEGGKLVLDISGRVASLSQINSRIAKLAATGPAAIRDRLISRIGKLAPEVKADPARLATEAALLADRVDISEEIVRLRAHIEELELGLSQSGAGRKLDFLLQECVREINTMGSKAQQAEIQKLVVEAKTVAEKIREQVQNIE